MKSNRPTLRAPVQARSQRALDALLPCRYQRYLGWLAGMVERELPTPR